MVHHLKYGVFMAPTPPKKPAQGNSSGAGSADSAHSAASKDIWLAGLGAMAQAQAQARAQGSKAFEALVAEGLVFQKKSQAAAQEKIHEAAAHFNQLTQNLGAGLVSPVGAKVDRLEHLFEDRVARALKSLGLPSSQEVAQLEDRVARLEAALAKTSTKASPKASAKTSVKSTPLKRAKPAK
jgi:poly(hydroxyalkanoate) granule-associated protein